MRCNHSNLNCVMSSTIKVYKSAKLTYMKKYFYLVSTLSILSAMLCKLEPSTIKKVFDGSKAFLTRIEELNKIDTSNILIPFTIDNYIYGYVNGKFYEKLVTFPDVFTTIQSNDKQRLTLSSTLSNSDMKSKTDAVHTVMKDLKQKGLISGWRDEFVPVLKSFSSTPAFLIERAAYASFGFKGYGVHINGFIRDNNGFISHLWVATRSKTKSTFPSMLDHIVAGGQPHGISPMENVIKECQEEANIPPSLAQQAVPVGAVSYNGIDKIGNLKRDILMCFDLELPHNFIPQPVDGEVDKFELHSIDDVVEHVMEGGSNGYKPNCNLVLIDFFVRHGILPVDMPHYLDIVNGLRQGECA